jgi:hypothetical protein
MKNRGTLLLILTASMFSMVLSAHDSTPNEVSIAVTKVVEGEFEGRRTYDLNFSITNHSRVPVFLPRRSLGKPNGIATLEPEILQNENWKSLPTHHELPELVPVKIEPGETYEDEFGLLDPFPVSIWETQMDQANSTPLKGKLRVKVRYAMGESEWQAYVVARTRAWESASSTLPKVPPLRPIYSVPFELPSDTQ